MTDEAVPMRPGARSRRSILALSVLAGLSACSDDAAAAGTADGTDPIGAPLDGALDPASFGGPPGGPPPGG